MSLTQLHPEGLSAGFPRGGILLLLHADVLHHQVHDTEQHPARAAEQQGGDTACQRPWCPLAEVLVGSEEVPELGAVGQGDGWLPQGAAAGLAVAVGKGTGSAPATQPPS